MLQKNPLHRPWPVTEPAPAENQNRAAAPTFVSAEDFDQTGILTGVDPCESRYWWMQDLYGPEADVALPASSPDPRPEHAAFRSGGPQATRRSTAGTTTAA
jgi:hypothetical protein